MDEEQVAEQEFIARVVLLNTQHGGRREMAWSDAFTGKKAARQDAARLAWHELNGTSPHLGSAALSVHVASAGQGALM